MTQEKTKHQIKIDKRAAKLRENLKRRKIAQAATDTTQKDKGDIK